MTSQRKLQIATFVVLIVAIVIVAMGFFPNVGASIKRTPHVNRKPGYTLLQLPHDLEDYWYADVMTFCDHGNRIYQAGEYWRGANNDISVVPNDPTCQDKP